MKEKECIFCRIVERELPADVVYEDNRVLVFLDIDWATKGHSLVVWKNHRVNASDLPEKDFAYFSRIFHKTEKALLEVLQKDRSVILKTGGLVPHFHFHIYPVSSRTSWQEIKDMFDKKTRYQPREGEKERLIEELRARLAK